MNSSFADSQSLTLLIPTRNRPARLRRLLACLQQLQCRHSLVVADSSDLEPATEVRRIMAEVQDVLRVNFSQHPPEIPPLNKVNLALNRVQSKLVALLADDDFYLPRALKAAADFLVVHADYSAVLGQARGFIRTPLGGIRWTDYPQRGIEQETVDDRLRSNFEGYTTNWYSVQRTAALRDVMNRAVIFEQDVYLMELFVSACLVAQGRVKKLDDLFLLREGTAKKEYAHISTYEAITRVWRSELHDRFVKHLALFLVERAGLDPRPAAGLAEEALLRYAGRQLATLRRPQVRNILRQPVLFARRYSILRAYGDLPRLANVPQDGKVAAAADLDFEVICAAILRQEKSR